MARVSRSSAHKGADTLYLLDLTPTKRPPQKHRAEYPTPCLERVAELQKLPQKSPRGQPQTALRVQRAYVGPETRYKTAEKQRHHRSPGGVMGIQPVDRWSNRQDWIRRLRPKPHRR